jgi:hypothetical protein
LVRGDAVVVHVTRLAILPRRALARYESVEVLADALVGSDTVVIGDTSRVVLPRAAHAVGNHCTGLRIGPHLEGDAAASLQAIGILVADAPGRRTTPTIAVDGAAEEDAQLAAAALGFAVARTQDPNAVLHRYDVLSPLRSKRNRIKILAHPLAVDCCQTLAGRARLLRKELEPINPVETVTGRR